MIWMKIDQKRVSLVFLFAIPETDARAYMNLISGMARLSNSPRLVERLVKAGDTFEMLNVLKQVNLRGSPPTLA
jgi:mannitol/fructose-specific phosphotransferase system IIA component (Ntr-type)